MRIMKLPSIKSRRGFVITFFLVASLLSSIHCSRISLEKVTTAIQALSEDGLCGDSLSQLPIDDIDLSDLIVGYDMVDMKLHKVVLSRLNVFKVTQISE